MAQQTINVGTAPNDGTGTPLRTAFQYTNSNFTELYTATGPSGNNINVPGAATITGNLTVQTNKLFVSATGAAVGTTSIFGDFTVQRSTNARFEIDSSSTGISYQVVDNARTGYLQNVTIASQHLWFNGVTEAMRLNSTGLGVGGSPGYKLDVAGSSAGVLRLVNINNSSTDPAAVTRLSLDSQGATWHLDNERTSGIFKITRNSTACLTIDNSGNVGIGVTPSAWPAASKAIDVDSYGANYAIAAATQVGISRNCYYNGTNWIYKLTTSAQRFEQDNGGGFKWFTAAAGTAGTAVTFTQSMTLESTGSLVLGAAAVATTATDGFLYIPGCAGTPTGTPTAKTGRVPLVVDTTNNKLYFYSGGAWVAAN